MPAIMITRVPDQSAMPPPETVSVRQPASSMHVLPDIRIFNEEAVVLVCFPGERPRLDKFRTHVDLEGMTQIDMSSAIPCIVKVTGLIIPGEREGTQDYYSVALGPPSYCFSHVGRMMEHQSVYPAIVMKHNSHYDGLLADINFKEYDKLCNVLKYHIPRVLLDS
ncbi:uncharacterized protein ARMOST_17385 [Armillaria ostoyae]|uniref:Uncharacterized protein n=1 Tax=Armillaria ostoyae TaxID=47428 RepID=A0A284RYU8_ARMOS|nr:uncharacterized protein ARMOST_17385 [Armillaria ostoyae]